MTSHGSSAGGSTGGRKAPFGALMACRIRATVTADLQQAAAHDVQAESKLRPW